VATNAVMMEFAYPDASGLFQKKRFN